MAAETIQEQTEQIGLNIGLILKKLTTIEAAQGQAALDAVIYRNVILEAIQASETALAGFLEAVLAGQTKQQAILQQILNLVSPPPPVGFSITITTQGDNSMALKAGLDITLLDSGTATATLGFVDSVGIATSLPAGSTVAGQVWSSSNPAIVVTPSADGLSAALAPSTPPVLATAVTISVSAGTVTNADGTTETVTGATSQPIDVVAGGPAGFSLAVTEP
jgi:hypothetical protein